jgi:branched-chain amino acid transport system substrate-binding protein
MTSTRACTCLAVAVLLHTCISFARAEETKTIRVGVFTFLSGPGAGANGIPGRDAADLTFEALNSGALPAPYRSEGFGGNPIEWVIIDEAGPTSVSVTAYRNLVQRRGVDMVIGYISSANCLAVAPVAEELRTLTVFFDCGTSLVFEEASYRYVFRTASHATMDSVGAARYVMEKLPAITRIAGINQNYSWGLDSWRDFAASMKMLAPRSEIATSQLPKLFAGQYGAEISVLLASDAELIHTSLWGGDLQAFLLQAVPRDLFKRSRLLMTAPEIHKLDGHIPDGTIIGVRGPHSVFAPDTELNRWFKSAYEKRYGTSPLYPAYHMVQAILGTKAAYEKAKSANDGRAPDQEQIAAAFQQLTFETPSGITKMALGNGHQGIQGTAYGMSKMVDGKLTITDVKHYSAEEVNPPEGIKSEEWIKSGFVR